MRKRHLQLLDCELRKEIWCQRRDSNSQTPVSKTGRYSNSRTLALVHRGGFEPPRPTWGDRVTAGPFRPGSRTCANLAEGRRIERPSLITTPWFSGPVADHSAVPSAMAESAGVEPASLLREPLFSRQVPYRPAHSTQIVKERQNSGRPGGS